MAIYGFLKRHAEEEPVSFHMPGHKGSAIYKRFGYEEFLNNIMDCDITEIPGADNLFQCEGIIDETMEKYGDLYDVRKSYLLVNGSSSGLIAAILATSVPGGKVAIARNSHKSIFNALTLGNLDPVYIYPDELEEYNILGGIDPEKIDKLLEENEDVTTVVIPSPNYYGICSDVEEIAKVCHRHGKFLVVDQAHGAHLKFMHKFGGELGEDYPDAAEDSGADIVINSIHKTLASWTQTALLNVCSDKVNLLILEDKLQQIESSSPSYPLMASLDINAELLKKHGRELIEAWEDNIEYFYQSAFNIPGLKMILAEGLDGTKINLDMSAYGLTGLELEAILNEKRIYPELVTGNIVMCMTGIGNTFEHFERLLRALLEIATSKSITMIMNAGAHEGPSGETPWTRVLQKAKVPVIKEPIDIYEAEGRVCASSIIPYPPGIPIVCPGEIIDREMIDYVMSLRHAGEKVIGISENNEILVGK